MVNVKKEKDKCKEKEIKTLEDVVTHYCPGCGHGIVHRLVADAINRLGIREKTIGIAPIGCSVLIYNYLNVDFQEVPHGRAPAAATGIKRAQPDKVVFTYQGDGDLASIGTAEIVHAANRGENITTIFINNAIYGMTGGQMAPTTLLDQKTTTSPYGRNSTSAGFPLKVCELLSSLDGVAYLERVSVSSPKNVVKAKRVIKHAFEVQLANKGFSLVEVLSQCPMNWRMSPIDSVKWVDDVMSKTFPLKKFKDTERVWS